MKRNNYVVANWKMNGLTSFVKIFNAINKHLVSKKLNNPNVIVCPPYTLINTLVSSKKSKVINLIERVKLILIIMVMI